MRVEAFSGLRLSFSFETVCCGGDRSICFGLEHRVRDDAEVVDFETVEDDVGCAHDLPDCIRAHGELWRVSRDRGTLAVSGRPHSGCRLLLSDQR